MAETDIDPDINCEWGSEGLARALERDDVIVIVDVLSFSTAVEIATNHGALVYPCSDLGDAAKAFADSVGATLASPARSLTNISLSPASLVGIASGSRIALCSPNGARLARQAEHVSAYLGCLRNAKSVAARARKTGRHVTVIAAGEQWEDGTMRVAVEDLLGAGAIIAKMQGDRSTEAAAAAAVFERFADDLPAALSDCVSGKELIERGFAKDVELAAQHNVSRCVPVMRLGAFVISD
jgi:2-phosphosulfolactate phosphatase